LLILAIFVLIGYSVRDRLTPLFSVADHITPIQVPSNIEIIEKRTLFSLFLTYISLTLYVMKSIDRLIENRSYIICWSRLMCA
jgi:hypothetical protein